MTTIQTTSDKNPKKTPRPAPVAAARYRCKKCGLETLIGSKGHDEDAQTGQCRGCGNPNGDDFATPFMTVTPNFGMKPDLCIELIEVNMGYIIHNFRKEWTKARNLGAKWECRDGIAGRTEAYRAFLHEWHGLLESDMYMVDYIEQQIGMPRANYPGVYSTFTVEFKDSRNTLTFIVRGRPITPDMYDRIHLRADHISTGEIYLPEIKKQIEQFLRGEGFEVIEVTAPRSTPMVI
jgi:hypothetical protein